MMDSVCRLGTHWIVQQLGFLSFFSENFEDLFQENTSDYTQQRTEDLVAALLNPLTFHFFQIKNVML